MCEYAVQSSRLLRTLPYTHVTYRYASARNTNTCPKKSGHFKETTQRTRHAHVHAFQTQQQSIFVHIALLLALAHFLSLSATHSRLSAAPAEHLCLVEVEVSVDSLHSFFISISYQVVRCRLKIIPLAPSCVSFAFSILESPPWSVLNEFHSHNSVRCAPPPVQS